MIKPQFDFAHEFSENGLARVSDPNCGLHGYIDKTGEYMIEPQFKAAHDFSNNGLALVTDAETQL